MEKLTENMIRFAESKLGSTEYAGWCLYKRYKGKEETADKLYHIRILKCFRTEALRGAELILVPTANT